MTTLGFLRTINGTALTFKNTGGDGKITLTSLGAGAAWQSDKYTFSSALARARGFGIILDWKPTSVAAAGGTVDLFWSPSYSATPGTGNAGGASGVDGSYAGYSSNLVDALGNLIPIGSARVTAFNGAHRAYVGDLVPPTPWGSWIVLNNMSVAFSAVAADHFITAIPNLDTAENP